MLKLFYLVFTPQKREKALSADTAITNKFSDKKIHRKKIFHWNYYQTFKQAASKWIQTETTRNFEWIRRITTSGQ